MSVPPANAPWRALYPFASHTLEIDGLRYHYVDEGDGDVLLLVHGNPTWSFYWREVISALRPHCRVIAVDHIGCGLSAKPSPAQYDYRLAHRVSDLCRLVETLKLQRVTLIAHDWGGAIGMGAAVALPQRFARFVLMNTAAFRAEHCPWAIRLVHLPFFGQPAVQGLNLFVETAIRTAACKPLPPMVRAGLRAPYDTWEHRAAVYRFVADIPLSPAHPSYQTLTTIEEGLPQFRDRPMCLIWGMRDWCFGPAFLERFIAVFPEATVCRIPRAGHYVVEDAAAEVIAAIRGFLDDHPLQDHAKTLENNADAL